MIGQESDGTAQEGAVAQRQARQIGHQLPAHLGGPAIDLEVV
jgi:hypothetical protein